MKRSHFLRLCLAASLPDYAQRSPATLKLAYYDAFYPVSFKKDDVTQGIMIDILNQVLGQRMGLKVSHESYPWTRAQKTVEDGSNDAMCTVSTPARLAYAEASNETVLPAPNRLFINPASPLLSRLQNVKTLEELKPLDPLVVTYLGNNWAKEHMQGYRMESAPVSLQNALKMLSAGRADVMVESVFSAAGAMRDVPESNKLVLGAYNVFTVMNVLLVSKSSPFRSMLPAFDKEMAGFRNSPAYTDILAKYNIKL